MSRALYWLVKLIGLSAALAALGGCAWFIGWLLEEHGRLLRRGFYSACMMGIFLYVALAARQFSRWLRLKGDQLEKDK